MLSNAVPRSVGSNEPGKNGPPASRKRSRPARVAAEGATDLPTNTGTEWKPIQAELDAWEKAYPEIDIPATMLEMRAWLIANPTRRKTFDGMPRFVNTWLSKEQNRL